jgi:hypothetical protein
MGKDAFMKSHPCPSGFRPGAKVVCLNDRFPAAAVPRFHSLPRAGRVYTLRSLEVRHDYQTGELAWSCTLAECLPVPTPNGRECGLALNRFQLVDDTTARTRVRHRRGKARFANW